MKRRFLAMLLILPAGVAWYSGRELYDYYTEAQDARQEIQELRNLATAPRGVKGSQSLDLGAWYSGQEQSESNSTAQAPVLEAQQIRDQATSPSGVQESPGQNQATSPSGVQERPGQNQVTSPSGVQEIPDPDQATSPSGVQESPDPDQATSPSGVQERPDQNQATSPSGVQESPDQDQATSPSGVQEGPGQSPATSPSGVQESPDPDQATTPDGVQESQGLDWSVLAAVNPDIKGWIRIPGTKIDYPVMQGKDNEEYILHNFRREATKFGSIFLDSANGLDPRDDNLIIYGHHMKDGQMFGELINYEKRSFLDQHPLIEYESPGSPGRYEIVAVFRTSVYGSQEKEFPYYLYRNLSDDAEFTAFQQALQELALYPLQSQYSAADDFITLSTCEYTQENGRLVVVAKRIKD